MSESVTTAYDEEMFSDALPDAALERAAGKCWEGAYFTLAFCSGLDTCPASPQH
jgi:hypothetical protein